MSDLIILTAAATSLGKQLVGSEAERMAKVPHEDRDISIHAFARYIVINPGTVPLMGKRNGVGDLEVIPIEIFQDCYLCEECEGIKIHGTEDHLYTDLQISAADLVGVSDAVKAAFPKPQSKGRELFWWQE